MDPHLDTITAAVAPVVMVSAAGLLFTGLQAKNFHLADRIRALAQELRGLAGEVAPSRRRQLVAQIALFERRLRLNHHALELLYVAILCFTATSLLLMLSALAWVRAPVSPALVAPVFVVGVAVLLLALLLEFLELRTGLRTIEIELEGVRDPGPPGR